MNARLICPYTLKRKKPNIMVNNYGKGVNVEHLRELTTPFHRAHNASNVNECGISIGITWMITGQHCGIITFQHWDHSVMDFNKDGGK